MHAVVQEPKHVGYSPGPRAVPQLSRRGIAVVWAAAALPMGVLAWVVAPLLARALSGPAPLAQALLVSLTAGLAWQAVLVGVLVVREQGSLRWELVRDALWLRAPRSPRTGRVGGRVWWVVAPFTLVFAVAHLLPVLPHPEGRDLGLLLSSPDGEALLQGSWGWFALIAAMFVLNTAVGEELLFRGYLLPRMQSAFGRRDWVVNGLLFAAYHLHVPWAAPGALVDAVALSFSSRRYRSALVGIAVHSVQSLFLTAAVLTVVL